MSVSMVGQHATWNFTITRFCTPWGVTGTASTGAATGSGTATAGALALGAADGGEYGVFAGLVAQGVGLWIGFQSFINIGVNLGALPTKGLTLPLMSFGGSAILMNLVAIAVVLRVDYENKLLMRGGHA